MRILLYGGCHAQILRDYLKAIYRADVDCTLIVNFDLIRRGAPFPYDSLEGYNAVVFSPIENKGEYNTTHLVAACRSVGVPTICFPWLEWHGYTPGATKGTFKRRFQWYYPGLIEKASGFRGTLDEFYDDVVETFPDDDLIDACFERSTAHVKDAEVRHAVEVPVSAFILQRCRMSRLFLVPDHPSRACYLHVLSGVLSSLGLAAPPDALAAISPREPQWQWRLPILPRVARRLGLAFQAIPPDRGPSDETMWIDDDVLPAGCLDLRAYLGLYYHADSIILGPRHRAPIFVSSPECDARGVSVDPTTRLLATSLDQPEGADYRLIDVLSDDEVPIAPYQTFAIDPSEWRTSWPT